MQHPLVLLSTVLCLYVWIWVWVSEYLKVSVNLNVDCSFVLALYKLQHTAHTTSFVTSQHWAAGCAPTQCPRSLHAVVSQYWYTILYLAVRIERALGLCNSNSLHKVTPFYSDPVPRVTWSTLLYFSLLTPNSRQWLEKHVILSGWHSDMVFHCTTPAKFYVELNNGSLIFVRAGHCCFRTEVTIIV